MGIRRMHREVGTKLCKLAQVVHNLYKVDKWRGMRRPGQVPPVGDMRNSWHILAENTEAKRPHGRPRLRWKYMRNIETNLRGMECKGKDCVYLSKVGSNDHCLGLIAFLLTF
jgi:hypothetical protein